MSRTIFSNPTVNASLIHELRMIAESFFRTRRDESFWSSRKPASTTLKCVFCLREGNLRARDAIAVSNGNSVCGQHSSQA